MQTTTKQHRILVVGAGSIGERHLRCLQKSGRCESLGFCEPLSDRRDEIAARYRIPDDLVFEDLDQGLNSGRFNGVVVAAPAPFHIPMGQKLAERGIHILMEKPLSLSLDGVEAFRETVKLNGVVVAVGYTHRAHPGVQLLKEKLNSTETGDLYEIRIEAAQPLAVLRPAYADVYFADRKMGGGSIQDMITHHYSVAEWLAGPVDRIVTHARHLGLPRVDVEDTVHSMADHGGVMVNYTHSLLPLQNECFITANCTRGSIRVDYGRKRVSTITKPNGEWTHESFSLDEIDEIYIHQNNAFLDAVEEKREVLCSLDEAIQTLKVNLASLRSMEDGQWHIP